MVTTPQDVALLDSRKNIEFARALQLKELGLIENMSALICPHCGKTIYLFKQGEGERAAQELNVPFLGALPIDPRIVNDTDDGNPFVTHDPSSEVNTAFRQTLEHILKLHSP